MVIFPCHGVMKTLILNMDILWHDQLMTVKTLETSDSRIWGTISVIIFSFKGTVMQIEKPLINYRLRVSKVS